MSADGRRHQQIEKPRHTDLHHGETKMSDHRRYMREQSSSETESWSSDSSWSSCSSMWSWSSISETEADDDDDVHGGGHRQVVKPSSASLPLRRRSRPSCSWVIFNRAGARRDDFRSDATTSAISRTSKGEEVSVSFELVEPPGTSVLAVDWPRPATTPTPRTTTRPLANVIAAHRDVVLLAMSSDEHTYPFDLFVYRAASDGDDGDPSRRRRRPSLSLLPSLGGPAIYSHFMDAGDIGTGIMSCTTNDGDGDGGGSPAAAFVVAELQMRNGKNNHVRLFRSGTGQWVSFNNLHVHGANGGRNLRWWRTNGGVVTYGRRYMIWVDYYRGMVLMDLLSSQWSSSEMMPTNPRPPTLRYVPLPVNQVGDPEHWQLGFRGCPGACRRVCATRYGIKFVSIDSQHWSDFGVGNFDALRWSHRFRITTWSLCEDDYTWRRDLTVHEDEFWEAIDGGDRYGFPHVQPRFPVTDMDNPDVIVFRLEKQGHRRHRDETKWMIEVDLRKKVLLAATAYSKKSDGLSANDGEDINSARMKSGFDPIPTELPRYLDCGQACKKRRQ